MFDWISTPFHVWIIFIVVNGFLYLIPMMRICKRLGKSPLLGFVCLVPLGPIFVTWWIAYSKWNTVRIDDDG